jgi:anti-sigma factor RsiW
MTGRMETNRPENGQCAAVEILLAEYRGGELDRAEAQLVEDHLGQCRACRAELARELHLSDSLGSLPLVKCPQRVTDAILAVVDETESIPAARPVDPPLSRRWTTFVGLAAAAAALVLMLAGPLDNGQPDQKSRAGESVYTQAEVDAARADLKRSLQLTARIINQTERSTVKEVFGHTLPESLTRSIKTLMTTPEGGQG